MFPYLFATFYDYAHTAIVLLAAWAILRGKGLTPHRRWRGKW